MARVSVKNGPGPDVQARAGEMMKYSVFNGSLTERYFLENKSKNNNSYQFVSNFVDGSSRIFGGFLKYDIF